MTLGDKLRSLRAVEGSLRGLGRAMTQQEMVKAMKREVGKSVSQAYLSQIESGARPHLTNTTQQLLAKFFRVYPGFLVDDPPGYARELQSELRVVDAKIDSWLYAGASQFSSDPELQRALIAVAEHNDSRQAVLLLAEILRAPGLAERLADVLRPEGHRSAPSPDPSRREPPDAKRLPVRGYLKN
ncbi:MAG TPA: helix-turn-helix domain-containing protein [Candidatus Acidoferrum sp.]|nr:helix-turn-helix domain-containing protein [Candidatus Acidoferrum sp.]